MPSAKKVLVIDNSSSVRQQVRLALTIAGYDVLEAIDGKEGLDLVTKVGGVAMVLCDVNMPVMNGMQFLEKVARSVPVVMLTADGQPELKMQAKSLGAKGWIMKPFVTSQLVETIEKVTARR